jgi:hypothetical protein
MNALADNQDQLTKPVPVLMSAIEMLVASPMFVRIEY